jgi:hypothetical protein
VVTVKGSAGSRMGLIVEALGALGVGKVDANPAKRLAKGN